MPTHNTGEISILAVKAVNHLFASILAQNQGRFEIAAESHGAPDITHLNTHRDLVLTSGNAGAWACQVKGTTGDRIKIEAEHIQDWAHTRNELSTVVFFVFLELDKDGDSIAIDRSTISVMSWIGLSGRLRREVQERPSVQSTHITKSGERAALEIRSSSGSINVTALLSVLRSSQMLIPAASSLGIDVDKLGDIVLPSARRIVVPEWKSESISSAMQIMEQPAWIPPPTMRDEYIAAQLLGTVAAHKVELPPFGYGSLWNVVRLLSFSPRQDELVHRLAGILAGSTKAHVLENACHLLRFMPGKYVREYVVPRCERILANIGSLGGGQAYIIRQLFAYALSVHNCGVGHDILDQANRATTDTLDVFVPWHQQIFGASKRESVRKFRAWTKELQRKGDVFKHHARLALRDRERLMLSMGERYIADLTRQSGP